MLENKITHNEKNLSKAESLKFLLNYQKFLDVKIPSFFFLSKKDFELKENKILKTIEKNFIKKKL